MNSIIKLILASLGVAVLAIAANSGFPEPVEYYKGHSHKDGLTIGAPQHSGGTNKQGCHNGSVPYHCH
jgi:hypothetical protein